MDNDLVIYDGVKSIPLNSLPREAWTEVGVSGSKNRNRSTLQTQRKVSTAFDTLGIMNRCVHVRGTTIQSLPWSIYKGENTFISSDEVEFPEGFEWLEDLSSYLYLIESCMTLLNEAFILKIPSVKNATGVKGFQWLQPDSMEPIWGDNGITHFERRMPSGEIKKFSKEEILYIWRQDPFSETSPAVPPALAAWTSTNVLGNYDEFVRSFFARGAIKATILKVGRGARPAERVRLKKFWQRMMSGVANAWTTEVVSNDVEPVIIGEGVSDLDNAALYDARKRDIATTMGVPHSILFSNAATYSTAEVEERAFYTYTIIPESTNIAQQLNNKVFRELGLRFAFEWPRLNIFQSSAKERAEVMKLYSESRLPPSIGAKLAGINLPDDVEYDDLDKLVREEREARMSAVMQAAGGQQLNKKDPEKISTRAGRDTRTTPESGKSAEWVEDKGRLERWAKKRMPDVDPEAFSSEYLSNAEIKAIVEEVKNANAD